MNFNYFIVSIPFIVTYLTEITMREMVIFTLEAGFLIFIFFIFLGFLRGFMTDNFWKRKYLNNKKQTLEYGSDVWTIIFILVTIPFIIMSLTEFQFDKAGLLLLVIDFFIMASWYLNSLDTLSAHFFPKR